MPFLSTEKGKKKYIESKAEDGNWTVREQSDDAVSKFQGNSYEYMLDYMQDKSKYQ